VVDALDPPIGAQSVVCWAAFSAAPNGHYVSLLTRNVMLATEGATEPHEQIAWTPPSPTWWMVVWWSTVIGLTGERPGS